MGIAAGYHLATGKIPVVYMQNSGEGNIINPLASLTDKEVYNIPVLLLIGWRGRPGVKDEPQHVKQGKVTTGLLNTMGINYTVLSKDEDMVARQIHDAVDFMKNTNECYAIIIEKGTFEDYKLQNEVCNDFSISREEAIRQVAMRLEDSACVVSTTGMISRELFEARTAWNQGHERDFLTVGSMGHASQIALGIALSKPDKKIFCIDGDGAAIMHLGGLTVIGSQRPKNMVHIVLNNGAHDSVGGQPTAARNINLCAIAEACGYGQAVCVRTQAELAAALANAVAAPDAADMAPVFIEILVSKGSRSDLGRPKSSPIENKRAFMGLLRL